MSTVLDRVIVLAGMQSGIAVCNLGAHSAIYQDLRMAGDDAEEFAIALGKTFGEHVYNWPWHRFTDLNEPTILTVISGIAALVGRLAGLHGQNGSGFERLELGHVAIVIESGHWVDP